MTGEVGFLQKVSFHFVLFVFDYSVVHKIVILELENLLRSFCHIYSGTSDILGETNVPK